MYRLFYFFTVPATLIMGCFGKSHSAKAGEEELIKHITMVAGNNKAEINKTVTFYRQQPDTLKYKAALYLLENLSDQVHYTGGNIPAYRAVFAGMDTLYKRGSVLFNRSWDSVLKYGRFGNDNDQQVMNDLQTIRFEYIKKQIDASFLAWHLPWARHLSFEEFCEYLLPVKFADEELEDWKQQVQQAYIPKLDTTLRITDPKMICVLLNKELRSSFYIGSHFKCDWPLAYSDLVRTHTGTCDYATRLTTYVMTAMGVPVVMDYTPFWANKNLGHVWNVLLYKGKALHFMGTESDPGQDKIEFTRTDWMRRKRAKVFRRTFAIQKNSLAWLAGKELAIPEAFISTHMKDVTSEYLPVTDVHVSLNSKAGHQPYAYLCIFNDNKWKPISWAPVNFWGHAHFKDVGRDVLYLPACYDSTGLIPAGSPFIIDKAGQRIPIVPDTGEVQRLVIRRKYPEDRSNVIFKGEHYELFYWNSRWVSLGKQTAPSDSVVYSNAPQHGLFWVRNLDKGFQERIFTYENGKQVWW